ncbi:zinc finger protein [Salinifilum ghardaiensis]
MPYPFTWVPAEGHRHASRDDVPPPGREFPPDMSVTTLCGRQLTTATGEVAWFWPTCFDCDERVRPLAGVPARTTRTPDRSAREEHAPAQSRTRPSTSSEHNTGGGA